jgi:hypothetical protein
MDDVAREHVCDCHDGPLERLSGETALSGPVGAIADLGPLTGVALLLVERDGETPRRASDQPIEGIELLVGATLRASQ